MKVLPLLVATSLAALPVLLQAQPSAHYVPGIEGIKAASLPPPGWYVRDYNVGYYSSTLNNGVGNNTHLVPFQAYCYANVPRVIWITPYKVLGGYVGADVVLPIVYQSLTTPGYDHSTLGIGDFFTEATLSWHQKHYDLAVGAGAWMPTGDSGTPTRAGLGYWTPMLSAGMTWYFDEKKTWAVSALNRYEINTESRDSHITPGQAYTLEWGVSKTIKRFDLGVVGYYQQQVTKNHGPGPQADMNRAAAAGPEVGVAFPKLKLYVTARYDYEFMAENRAQGATPAIVFTKWF